MRKSLFVRAAIGLTAAVGVLAMSGGVASAGSVNHTQGGVVGAANCVGQTAAFVSQGNFNVPVGAPFGLGHISASAGISVQQAQGEIQLYCATGIIP